MNFFAARHTGGATTVGGLEIALDGSPEPVGDVEAVVGVRPEQVRVGEAGADELAMTGTVATVETLGAETLCHVEVDLPGVLVESGEVKPGSGPDTILVRIPGNWGDLEGESMQLRAAVEDLHVFDPASGVHIGAVPTTAPDRQHAGRSGQPVEASAT